MTDDTPTDPPPRRLPPRKLVTQVPAVEERAPALRGPLDPWPETRPKQASAPDLAALVASQLAEALKTLPGAQPDAEHPDKALGAAVRTIAKQVAGILAAAVVGAVATTFIRPSADPAKVDAQATQIKGNDAAVIQLQTDVAELKRWKVAMRDWAVPWTSFELQIWNRMGVKVALPDTITPIQVVTPARWAQVKSSPLFEVQTSPPLPPRD